MSSVEFWGVQLDHLVGNHVININLYFLVNHIMKQRSDGVL